MSAGEHREAGSAARERLPVVLAVAVCVLLVPLELGWTPFLSRAWGFNLWQYLPAPAAGVLAAALLLLCLPSPRRLLQDGVRRGHARIRTAPPALRWLGWLALPLVFWALRERQLYGDSKILLYHAGSKAQFLFPDIGATHLFHWATRASDLVGIERIALVQALVCACGAIAVACFARLGRMFSPSAGRAALAAAFILCGGVVRVCFGHVEVYAFVLMCAGAYLWSACAYLRGRCRGWVPALALGVGIWMHFSFATLLPSLVLLPLLRDRSRAVGPWLARASAALLLAAAPTALFLVVMFLTGHEADLQRSWQQLLQRLHVDVDPEVQTYWLRGWGESPGPGTQWVLFSRGHLKYLANAFFVLAPAAVPVLLGFGLFAPRRFAATPEAAFLSVASLGTLVYACALRPIWGPYDWELFSLTAVCLASLAALLLVRTLDDPALSQLGAVLIGASLLCVAIPFVVVGIAPSRPAGPFAHGALRVQPGESAWQAFEKQIEPWL